MSFITNREATAAMETKWGFMQGGINSRVCVHRTR